MSRNRSGHRILLVGPWRGGSAGGGCCSAGPEGVSGHSGHAGQDGRAHAAAVLRELRTAAGEGVDVQLVDPRNTMYLVPTVYRDARVSGLGRRAALTQAMRSTTPWALVVDGTVVSRAEPPPSAEFRRLTEMLVTAGLGESEIADR